LDKHVDAIFYTKSSHEHWPLIFVDLKLSSTKIVRLRNSFILFNEPQFFFFEDVRECMRDRNLIREVSNEEIYQEFIYLIKPVDYIIYSIRHEDEENDDDDG
jgi:hypothetical protein